MDKICDDKNRGRITEGQYTQAVSDKKQAEDIITAYHSQSDENFGQRLKDNPIFTDDELIYAAYDLCPCGYGIAYPKDCSVNHYWDCAGILKGIADPNVEHTGQLPFAFYEVKSENQPSAEGRTTRGVFWPKPKM